LSDPQGWVTDDVIDFAVEHDLAADVPDVQFVNASVVLVLATELGPRGSGQIVAPRRTGRLVLLPISQDNRHWSLLVYDATRGLCVHYDSLRGINSKLASELCNALIKVGFVDPVPVVWEEPKGLVQNDGYNCGMFVIELMERIAQHGSARLEEGYLGEALSSDICDARRVQLLSKARAHFGLAIPAFGLPSASSQPFGASRASSRPFGAPGASGSQPAQRPSFDRQPAPRLVLAPQSAPRPRPSSSGIPSPSRPPALDGRLLAPYRRLQQRPNDAAAWQRAYLDFEGAVEFKQHVFDAFIEHYEPLYQRYHTRKRELAGELGFPAHSGRRLDWPQLWRDRKAAKQRKRTSRPASQRRYGGVTFTPGTIVLALGDEAEAFDAMIKLTLWRKVFAAKYPRGLDGSGVAHMLWLETPYGNLAARNVKNTAGDGTTRLLLPFSDGGFWDASYKDLARLLKLVAQATRASDADIAHALLFLVFGGNRPTIDLRTKVNLKTNKVCRENWGETMPDDDEEGEVLYLGSDAVSSNSNLRDLSGMTTGDTSEWHTYTLPAGLLLVYVVGVLFLLEARHTHAFWIGNRYALLLVARGWLTFDALFADIDNTAHSGNLIPSYQYKPNYKTHQDLYFAAKQRLVLSSVVGYYTGAEGRETDDSFSDVRGSLAADATSSESTKLFTVHKLLFAWLLAHVSEPRPAAALPGRGVSSTSQPPFGSGVGSGSQPPFGRGTVTQLSLSQRGQSPFSTSPGRGASLPSSSQREQPQAAASFFGARDNVTPDARGGAGNKRKISELFGPGPASDETWGNDGSGRKPAPPRAVPSQQGGSGPFGRGAGPPPPPQGRPLAPSPPCAHRNSIPNKFPGLRYYCFDCRQQYG
jgi:Ulp1 protease family, C-terminal catalytic domain